MEVALKTLEPYIKDATHLQTGKPFQNFGDMRSREAVVNWLLCATINAFDQRKLSFDLIGGDGIIDDEKSGDIFPTEHGARPIPMTSRAAGSTSRAASLGRSRRKPG